MNVGLADQGSKLPVAGVARTRSAIDTLRMIVPLMPRFGITRVADVTGLDRVGIPVAIAVRPAARSVTVSQGKGPDLASAKVAALMEAIEVWHAENIDAPLLLASIEEARQSGRSCDANKLPVVEGSRFLQGSRLLWIEGDDLISGRRKLVPFEMVHADYAAPVKPGHGLFPASTNGLASGNHRLEAICGAVCEIIERDALALWHRRPLARRSESRLDSSTIDDPLSRWASGRIIDAGLDLAVWDITSDLEVAAFLSLVRDPEDRGGHVGLGSGAHPDRNVALLRALTEAAQTRLTYISGSRDDLDPEEFTPRGRAQKRHFAEMLLRAGPPSRSADAIASVAHAKFGSDLDWLLGRLVECGIEEAVAVDLGKAPIGIPVVRVIIPGLESPHDDPGYVPGPRAIAAAAAAGAP